MKITPRYHLQQEHLTDDSCSCRLWGSGVYGLADVHRLWLIVYINKVSMADVGQPEQPGGRQGPWITYSLNQSLTQLLNHYLSTENAGKRAVCCQFMFQTLQQLVRMALYSICKGQRAVFFYWLLPPEDASRVLRFSCTWHHAVQWMTLVGSGGITFNGNTESVFLCVYLPDVDPKSLSKGWKYLV